MTRAALYARVSTGSGAQDVGLQLEEMRRVAAQRGWEVVGEFTDVGVSGARVDRPGLDGLLAAARAAKIDLVVVWKLDRLGRSLIHLLQVLDELRELRVGFASIRDPGIDTTTPTGRLLLQLLALFAEYERTLIRERVRAGVSRSQAAGTHCGRPRVEIDLRPAQALLNEGRSVRETAAILRLSEATLRRRLAEAT